MNVHEQKAYDSTEMWGCFGYIVQKKQIRFSTAAWCHFNWI